MPHKPGHKRDLWLLAGDLAELRRAPGGNEIGGLARAVAEGRAPTWVAANLETLEVLERKMYNRHDLAENVKLAFEFPPRIVP